jgi:hypothetical protein
MVRNGTSARRLDPYHTALPHPVGPVMTYSAALPYYARSVAGIDLHQSTYAIGIVDPNGVEFAHSRFRRALPVISKASSS